MWSKMFRLPLLAVALVALSGFAADTYLVLSRPYPGFDVSVERAVQAFGWGPLVQLFAAVDWLEGLKQVTVAVLAILFVFLVRRRATWLMIWGLLSGVSYQLSEMAIQRPRPPAGMVHVIRHTGGYSYPSGHVVFFTWLGAYLLLVFARGLPRPVQPVLWALYVLLLAIVCLGRVYTGEHWPSDVLAGLCLGAGWATLGLAIRRLSDPVLAP